MSLLEHWLLLLGTLVRFPAPTRWLMTTYNSSSGGVSALSWPPWTLFSCVSMQVCGKETGQVARWLEHLLRLQTGSGLGIPQQPRTTSCCSSPPSLAYKDCKRMATPSDRVKSRSQGMSEVTASWGPSGLNRCTPKGKAHGMQGPYLSPQHWAGGGVALSSNQAGPCVCVICVHVGLAQAPVPVQPPISYSLD